MTYFPVPNTLSCKTIKPISISFSKNRVKCGEAEKSNALIQENNVVEHTGITPREKVQHNFNRLTIGIQTCEEIRN